MSQRSLLLTVSSCLIALAACIQSTPSSDCGTLGGGGLIGPGTVIGKCDGGVVIPDAGPDGGILDAGPDAGPDAGIDAGPDGGSHDGGFDGGEDGGRDAGFDAGPDGGQGQGDGRGCSSDSQ